MKKLLYACFIILTIMSCSSSRNITLTQEQINKEYQKAYNDNSKKKPVKKELTLVTIVAVLLTTITFHFMPQDQ